MSALYHAYLLFMHLIWFKVSKVIGCNLVRLTDLDFKFSHGSCNTFTEPEPKVLLCFDEDNARQCHT